MRAAPAKVCFAALLTLVAAALVGCRHKVPAPPVPVATAPPLPPSSMTQVPSVPAMPAPKQPQVGPPGPDQAATEPPPQPVHKPRRAKKKPPEASTTASATTAPPVPVATNAQPLPSPAPATPAASLGQLSAGASTDSHEQAVMSEQIRMQETRLSKLKHPLGNENEAIAKQIELFLLKARQAATDNDLDGAQTLTTKAKVLLDELSGS